MRGFILLLLLMIPFAYAPKLMPSTYIVSGPYCMQNHDCQIKNLNITGNISNVTILNINTTGYINAYGFHENGTDLHDIFVDESGDVMTGTLNMTDNIIMNDTYVWYPETTGTKRIIQVNNYGMDSFNMEYWYNFEALNDDWLILRKTDGNDARADGGIGIVFTNASGYNRTVLKIDGYGLANFTDYSIRTRGNIIVTNITALGNGSTFVRKKGDNMTGTLNNTRDIQGQNVIAKRYAYSNFSRVNRNAIINQNATVNKWMNSKNLSVGNFAQIGSNTISGFGTTSILSITGTYPQPIGYGLSVSPTFSSTAFGGTGMTVSPSWAAATNTRSLRAMEFNAQYGNGDGGYKQSIYGTAVQGGLIGAGATYTAKQNDVFGVWSQGVAINYAGIFRSNVSVYSIYAEAPTLAIGTTGSKAFALYSAGTVGIANNQKIYFNASGAYNQNYGETYLYYLDSSGRQTFQLVVGNREVFNATKNNVTIKDIKNIGNLTAFVPFGEIWNRTSGGFTFAVASSGVYYNGSGFECGQLNAFLCNKNASNLGGTYLTALRSGYYQVNAHVSGEGQTAGGQYGVSIAKNFNQELTRDCYINVDGTDDINVIAITCIMQLNKGDKVNLKFEDESSPTKNFILYSMNLNLQRIGG